MNILNTLLGNKVKTKVDHLILGLQDSDSSVRESSTREMISLGKPAVKYLIQYLGDSDKWARLMAAAALGKIGDPLALESLKKACADPDPGVRSMVQAALMELRQQKDRDEAARRLAEWSAKEPRCSRCGRTSSMVARDMPRAIVVGNLVGVCPVCRNAFCIDHAPYNNDIMVDSIVCPVHRAALDLYWDNPATADKPWRIGPQPIAGAGASASGAAPAVPKSEVKKAMSVRGPAPALVEIPGQAQGRITESGGTLDEFDRDRAGGARTPKSGYFLSVSGALLAATGIFLGLMMVLGSALDPALSKNPAAIVASVLTCPLPILLVGAVLLAGGIYVVRKADRPGRTIPATAERVVRIAAPVASAPSKTSIHKVTVNEIVHEASGSTKLHLACSSGDLEQVKTLLAQGASVNISNKWGATPLDLAISNAAGHPHAEAFTEIQSLLRAKGGQRKKGGAGKLGGL